MLLNTHTFPPADTNPKLVFLAIEGSTDSLAEDAMMESEILYRRLFQIADEASRHLVKSPTARVLWDGGINDADDPELRCGR
jgi:hypothetical protein